MRTRLLLGSCGGRELCVAALLFVCASASAGPWRVTVTDQDGRPIPDALVMFSDGSVLPADAANREIAQRNAEFEPRVSVVSRGTAVQFPNRDRARHHVYSFSSARTFEIELYKGTPSEPVVFDRNGIVTVGCNVHDWMYGVVYVIDTPYYAVTGRRGRVRLDAPKADSFAVTVWHPDQVGAGFTDTVTLDADHRERLSITLPLRPTAPRPSRPPPIDELDDY